MMTVAVVAGRHFGSYVRPAQGHGFAVVSIAIMFKPVFMTLPATLVAGHFEMSVFRRFHLVGSVTIDANGTALVTFGEQLAMNTLIIGLLDFDMALATGFGNVGGVNGGLAVHRPLDIVHAVTIIAGRRYD